MIKQVQAPKQMHKYQYPFIPAPKVAVVKSNQVVTKVKEGIMEVRDMFQKVDHAFKKRKEESQVLAMTVSDLENHLAYLESQTQDQMASTTSLGSALYSRQEQINKLSKDVKEFEALDSAGFQTLFDEMKESTELAADTGALIFEQSRVLENFMCEQGVTLGSLESTMEKYLAEDAEEAAEMAKLLDDITLKEKEVEVAEANARAAQKVDDELNKAIEQSRHELPLKVSKLKSLQASLAEKKIQCEQLTQQTVSLTEELTALDTIANTHRVAFEAQNALRMEEIATLTATFEKTRLHKDAKYQELQALQNQKDTLDTEVAAGEAALRAITLTLRQEQATEEKLRTEVHHLDTKVQAIREELSAARAASEQAATDNEEQYQLTCARMTDLREAHQRQSSLSQTKHTLEEQLTARVRELTALAIVEEERAVREQQLLEQDETKLTAATATLATTRAEVATLQSRAATTTAEVQDQEEEVQRLSELQAQLTAQKEKQAALRLQLVELERLREAQKTDAAGAAQELHAQQQKQRALDEALVEARAAQKKKQGDPTPTATQLELFEVDVQAAVEEQQAQWQAKHAAEVAEIETCRAQLAKGFPEQTERAADEIHAKTAEVDAQRQAVQQADQALASTRAELQHQQHLRHQHHLHLQALALAQAQAQAQAEAEAKAKAAAEAEAIAEAEEQARQDAAAQALLVLQLQQLQQQQQAAEALAQAQRQAEALELAEAEAQAQALQESRRAAYAPQASQRVSQRAGATISSRASTPLSAADPFHLDLLLEHEHEHGGSGGVDVSSDRGSVVGGSRGVGRGGSIGIASTPAMGTSSMNRSVSEATTAFMSPATTFPVPYSETVAHIDTDITATTAKNKGKGRGKSGKMGIVDSQLPPASQSQSSFTPRNAEIPSMGSTMDSSSNNRDGLTRWERSEPAPPLQLPPHPAQLLAKQLSRGRGAGSSNTQSQQGSGVSRQGVVLSQVETSGGSCGSGSAGGMEVVVSEVQVEGMSSSQQSQFGSLFGDIADTSGNGDVGGIVPPATTINTTTATTPHSVLSTHSDDLFEDSHSHVHVATVTATKRAKLTTTANTQHTTTTRQLATTTISNTVHTSTHPDTHTTLPTSYTTDIPTTSHTTSDTSVSTPEEERAAKRREKNKAHKQNQKARSRAAKAAASDGASSVHSEDHSLDLLRPIAPVVAAAAVVPVSKPTTTTTTATTTVKPTNSNTNIPTAAATATATATASTTSKPSKTAKLATATTTMRPPLYKAPTVTPFAASLPGAVPVRAARPAPHHTTSRPSASSATSSAGTGTSAGSSSWDIFGLPSPSTTSGAGTSIAKKHTSKTKTTGATAQVPGSTSTTRRPTTTTDNTVTRQPTNFNTNTDNTNTTSTANPGRVVGNKRKHSLTAANTAPDARANTTNTTNTSTHATSHKRSTTTNKQSVTTGTTHRTNPTTTTAANSQRTKPTTTSSNHNTNTATSTTAPTTTASKKKKVSYVSEDWFDEEDAPF